MAYLYGDGKRKRAKQVDTNQPSQTSSSRYMAEPSLKRAPTTSLTGEPLQPTRRGKVKGIVSHKRNKVGLLKNIFGGGSKNTYGGRGAVKKAKSGADCFKGGKGCGPGK